MRVQQMSQLFNDREALGALLKEIKTEKDDREAFEALGTALSKTSRQVGRRLPFGAAFAVETMKTDPLPQPEEEPVPAPALDTPTASVVPVSPMRSLAPPPMSPRPSPLAMAPPPAASGRVDPERFKAFFPDDGIGSLFG